MGSDLTVGEVFAGYRIERLLGRGGMGVVYLGEHIQLGRKAALKLLSSELATDEAARKRFIRESQAAAALEHPNIVPIFDAGEVKGVAHIVMRYVDGPDLGDLLRTEGALSPQTTINILEQVASALDAAHAAGLVHRDVKPPNILLETSRAGTGWHAFLADFGVTKHLAGAGTTETGQFIGTIDYSGPEQIRTDPLDGRADQYSLACVLFQCLTGEVPFPWDEQLAVMYGHLQEAAPRVSDRLPGVRREVDAAVLQGMAKRPERRFPSCFEFVEATAAGLGVEMQLLPAGDPRRSGDARGPIRAPRRGGRRRTPSSRRWARLAPLLGLLGLVAVVAIVAALTAENRNPPTEAPSHRSTSGLRVIQPFPTRITWHREQDAGDQLGGPFRQVMNRAAAGDGIITGVGFEQTSTGTDGVVWVSDDGATWDRRTPGSALGPGDQVMDGVVFGDGRFYAVGTDSGRNGLLRAAVWSSPGRDNNWEPSDPGALADTQYEHGIHKVVPVDNGLIAVGWNTRTGLKDADVWQLKGDHWTEAPPDSEPGAQELWGVTRYGENALVAVGSTRDPGSPLDAAVWYSSDGQHWTQVTLRAPGAQIMKAVAAPPGGGLVAVGREDVGGNVDAAVWTSPDGMHWTRRPDPAALGGAGHQEMTGVIPYHGGLIASGEAGSDSDLDAAVWLSNDGGKTWSRSGSGYRPLGGPGEQEIKSLLVFHGLLVAVGEDSGSNEGDAAVWTGTPFHGPPTSPSPSGG